MRKVFFIISFIFLIQHAKTQSLSLSNLISLQKDSLNGIEDYLLNKNWEFASSKKEDDTTCAIVAFQSNLNTKKSKEILQYLYSKSDHFQRLWYTTFSNKKYSDLLAQAKLLRFALKDNKVEEESLSNLYFKKGLYIIFRTFHLANNSGSIIMYKIELYEEGDYNKILPL